MSEDNKNARGVENVGERKNDIREEIDTRRNVLKLINKICELICTQFSHGKFKFLLTIFYVSQSLNKIDKEKSSHPLDALEVSYYRFKGMSMNTTITSSRSHTCINLTLILGRKKNLKFLHLQVNHWNFEIMLTCVVSGTPEDV